MDHRHPRHGSVGRLPSGQATCPRPPLRIDCEPCVTAIHRGVKWATAGHRKHARVNALLLAALDDTPTDLVVWMPAHTKESDVGVKKLGNGDLLTGRDMASNGSMPKLLPRRLESPWPSVTR